MTGGWFSGSGGGGSGGGESSVQELLRSSTMMIKETASLGPGCSRAIFNLILLISLESCLAVLMFVSGPLFFELNCPSW